AHAGVGAAGDTPHAVECGSLAGSIVVPSGGSNPTQSRGLSKQRSAAFQGARDGPVGRDIGAIIADQSDADHRLPPSLCGLTLLGPTGVPWIILQPKPTAHFLQQRFTRSK